VAKTLAYALGKPLVWIDHIEAHMFANFLDRASADVQFPNVCLTVSGGHNEIYLWKSMFERELLGQTQDDAAGEAFDKIVKAMGLGFPGGPIVSKLALEWKGAYRGIFPIVTLGKESLDFSFSGLKTAVKREIDGRVASNGALTDEDRREIAFEFERTVVEILTRKLFLAAEKTGVRHLALAGGVSANDFLRETIAERASEVGCSFVAPISKVYSQDNAAMVGILAYYRATSAS
jgi:N6-L-threonylcarbamoyladenine synthase